MNALGPWLPDQPAIAGLHLIQCLNVVPASDHYGPFKAFAVAAAALDGACRGAAAFADKVSTVHVFSGDPTKLYELQSDASQLDVSRLVGGAYSLNLTSRWRFAPFGDYCLATCFDEEIQAREMSVPGTFENLTGSPPRAKHICTFRDFVFTGYTDTSSQEVRWSAINDHTGWTSGTDQSNAQILPDGGDIQGFAPTDTALLVFQQTKIQLFQYVGPPLIMQRDPFTEKLGCLEPGSLCQHGMKVFFLSHDGFYQIDSFQPPVSISEGAVSQFFLGDGADVPADFNASFGYRMSSAVDPQRQIAVWCYASRQSVTGSPDSQLFYYFGRPDRSGRGRWSLVRTPTELVFNALGLGYTLEDLDDLSASIDAFEIPLDDPLLRGGALRFGAFNHDAEYGVFAGETLEAVFETGDIEVIRGGRAIIEGVRPVIDTDEITVAVAARERPMDDAAYTADGTLEAHGAVSCEASGRYVRMMMTVAAGAEWTKAQGYDYDAKPDGEI